MNFKAISWIILFGLLFSTCKKDFEWKNPYDPENILDQSLQITTPNGGEEIELGVSTIISWQSQTVSEPIKLELYRGNSFHATIADSLNDKNEHSWQVPFDYPAASDYKIKVTSTANSSVNDLSDNQFTFYKPTITVISPTNNDNWYFGRSVVIKWSSSQVQGAVKIELYRGSNNVSVIAHGTTNDGDLEWSIPASLTAGSDYKIKIISVFNPNVIDYSTSTFTIRTLPTIKVEAPNGGEIWLANSTNNIQWDSHDIAGNVKIELYQGGSFSSIINSSTANDKSHSWLIPSNQPIGSDYKIRISSIDTPEIEGYSPSPFTISKPWEPKITITYPNGGETLEASKYHDINWTKHDIDGNVKIDVLSNNELFYALSSSTTNDGNYSWYVDRNYPENSVYRIQVTSLIDTSISDISDTTFSIRWGGSIDVTYPDSSAVQRGQSLTIRWTNQYVTGPVWIGLYRWDGLMAYVVHQNTGIDVSLGQYTWLFPEFSIPVGPGYKILVAQGSIRGWSAEFSVY